MATKEKLALLRVHAFLGRGLGSLRCWIHCWRLARLPARRCRSLSGRCFSESFKPFFLVGRELQAGVQKHNAGMKLRRMQENVDVALSADCVLIQDGQRGEELYPTLLVWPVRDPVTRIAFALDEDIPQDRLVEFSEGFDYLMVFRVGGKEIKGTDRPIACLPRRKKPSRILRRSVAFFRYRFQGTLQPDFGPVIE